MMRHQGWACAAMVCSCGCATAAQPHWVYHSSGAVPLSLAPSLQGGADSGRVFVGLESGTVALIGGVPSGGGAAAIAWRADAGSAVLAVLPLEQGDGREVVVGTSAGRVRCLRTDGTARWSVESSCNTSRLALLPDVDGDGTPEVIAGGADHRVRVINAESGSVLWTRMLGSNPGNAYVTRVAAAGDIDRDGASDVVAWTWGGMLYALGGRDGKELWARTVGQGFVDAMTLTDDMDADGLADIAIGDNSGRIKALSAADGTELWESRSDRPVREVVCSIDLTGDGIREVIAVTAGGQVMCLSGRREDPSRVLWAASLGDVARTVTLVPPASEAPTGLVVAGAENGRVAAFAGDSGEERWRWEGRDIVRAVCTVPDVDGDGINDVVAACLDGTVILLPGGARGEIACEPPAAPASRPAGSVVRREHRESDLSDSPNVIILLYHDVLPEAIYRWGVSVENFRAHMDILVEQGYVCVSLDDVADWVEGKRRLPRKSVCITFDGPYEGHYTCAAPILKERGLFATSYITTDWIGTANHADWHHLRELDASGVMNIQNHTLNHPGLDSVSQHEAEVQLTGSEAAIARRLGARSVRHHAYPNGSQNADVRQLVLRLGYRTATTVVPRAVRRTDDLIALPRVTLLTTTTLERFREVVRVPAGE